MGVTIDLTELLKALLGLCATLITGFLIPYIQKKTTLAQRENVMKWVQTAVFAAEQFKVIGMIDDKLAYVQQYLEDNNIHVDRATIEACVTELKLWDKVKAGLLSENPEETP